MTSAYCVPGCPQQPGRSLSRRRKPPWGLEGTACLVHCLRAPLHHHHRQSSPLQKPAGISALKEQDKLPSASKEGGAWGSTPHGCPLLLLNHWSALPKTRPCTLRTYHFAGEECCSRRNDERGRYNKTHPVPDPPISGWVSQSQGLTMCQHTSGL